MIESGRVLRFVLALSLIMALFSTRILQLVRASLEAGYSSHIVLVPLIVFYLIWTERKQIFSELQSGRNAAIALGVGAFFVLLLRSVLTSYHLAGLEFFTVLGILLVIVAVFAASFGKAALRKAAFPFSLFAFMLPLPGELIQAVIHFLQSQSAEVSYWLFQMLHVPVLRDGFVMTLPKVTIEVAAECSGINSSMALAILAVLVARETLHTGWRRAVFVLLIIPFSILKNAIRIVTLTTLAVKVDPGFLTGRLHHQGGFVFFLLTLAIVYPVWRFLVLSEEKGRRSRFYSSPPASATVIN